MRKASVTLSGAGLLACLILSSCVVKEDKSDDDDGGSSNKGGNTSAATTQPSNGNTGNVGKGGSTAAASSTSTSLATGGASSVTGTQTTSFATGGSTGGIVAAPCDGLLEQLKTSSDQVCSQSKQEASFTKMNMLIVLDKSGSMNSTPEGYTRTKWAGAIDALQKSLDPNSTLISFGISLYPYASPVPAATCELGSGDDAVNVKVGPALDTVPQINTLMANTSPGGGTPTAAALAAAYDYYTRGSGIGLEGTKYVLLVTDGGPNCNASLTCGTETCTAFMDKSPSQSSCWNGGVPNCCDPDVASAGAIDPRALCLDDLAVTAQLDSLRSAGIHTFVIGIPGSEAYANYLDIFAEAGGEPVVGAARKYYEVTGESGLADAFKTITTSLISSCVVPLTEKPKDTNKINVAIDCSALPQMTGEQRNWSYDEASQSIIIEGAKCEQIKAAGVNRIDVVNGCPVYVLE